jgi:hypothetical protein
VGLAVECCREVLEDLRELFGLVGSQAAGELVVRSDDFDIGGFVVGLLARLAKSG